MIVPRKSVRTAVALSAVLAAASVALLVPSAAPAGAVAPPPGAAKPTPGSGMGTAAALNNPKCQKGEQYGPYGRFNSTFVGGGPVCVKPWTASANNGGATYQGVTKNAVTIVFVVPNQAEINKVPGTAPVKRDGSGNPGSYQDAIHDLLTAYMKYYETWGRDINVKYVVSTGDDEASQRADAVTIEAMKPFAVVDFSPTGLDVLDTEMAKQKLVTFGYSTNTRKALEQAPYRWGDADAQAAAANSAEVIGRQLAGKKAEFGGDDVKTQARKFGTVYIDGGVDITQFQSALAKHKVTLATNDSYTASGATLGDTVSAQQQAPTIVAKMKAAGVTTVVLFTDVAMTKALMTQADSEDYNPEWFFTGTVFQDLALLARGYPADQMTHAFGISILTPYVQPDTAPLGGVPLSTQIDPLNWYWGVGVGTSTSSGPTILTWLMNGISAAGPRLTPKTFQQGLFAMPALGGAAQGYTTSVLTGYGKTAGLPYDEYNILGLDFSPIWWDGDTTGPSNGTGTLGKGLDWYTDGAARYVAKTVPTKQFGWFDKATSVYTFATRQPPIPVYVGPCSGCPATTGGGGSGTPDPSGFVAKASDSSG
jgi:hypothetical protein